MEKEKNMVVNTFAADSVKCLELRTAAASVNVTKASDREIRVEAKNLRNGDYICQVQNGTLTVIYDLSHARNLINWSRKEVYITLYLPAEMTFERIDLEVGAGEADMMDVPISCREMAVEIGAGKWRAAQLSVSGELDVQIGAGDVRIKRTTVGRLHIACGVGRSVFKGRVQNDIRVECGVGSCGFQLDNRESDFNYDISCAIGSVRINGNRVNCFGSKKIYNNHNARGTAVLECEVGSIELNTGSGAKAKAALHK